MFFFCLLKMSCYIEWAQNIHVRTIVFFCLCVRWKPFDKNILFNEKKKKKFLLWNTTTKIDLFYEKKKKGNEESICTMSYCVVIRPLLSSRRPYQNQHLSGHNGDCSNRDSRSHYREHRTNLLSLMICDNRRKRSNVCANYDFCLSSFRLRTLDIRNVGNLGQMVLLDHRMHGHRDCDFDKCIA